MIHLAKLPRSEKKALNAANRGVVAIDFDGTISDTVFETYVQSLKAYQELGGKVKHSPVVEKQYRAARPLITKVEHLFSVWKLIEANPHINFNHIKQEQMNAEFMADAERNKVFSEKFYANRKHMQTQTPEKWVALNKSFPKIAEFIKRARRYNDVYIATAKDKVSIMSLLKRYGIQIPEERIISVEFSKDKRLQLKEISRLSGKSLSKIVLVEDAIEQLKGAKEIGAKGLLYRRGYSTLAQKKEARKMGVAVVDWTRKFDSRRIKHLVRY